MNDKVARIKEEAGLLAQPLHEEVSDLKDGLMAWAEANRAVLTDGYKKKTVDLGTGELKWRLLPAKVTISGGDDAAIENMKRLGLQRFIRVKESPNRDAMREDGDAALLIPGVSIGSEGELFEVEPFEVEIAQEVGQ